MAERTAAQIAARVRATVVLARRLKLAPGTGKDHEAVAIALNLFGDERDVDRAIAALPAADRTLLARSPTRCSRARAAAARARVTRCAR